MDEEVKKGLKYVAALAVVIVVVWIIKNPLSTKLAINIFLSTAIFGTLLLILKDARKTPWLGYMVAFFLAFYDCGGFGRLDIISLSLDEKISLIYQEYIDELETYHDCRKNAYRDNDKNNNAMADDLSSCMRLAGYETAYKDLYYRVDEWNVEYDIRKKVQDSLQSIFKQKFDEQQEWERNFRSK